MATQEKPISDTISRIYGKVVATDVTVEDYMQNYAQHHCEYVEGVVIKLSPHSIEHSDLLKYFIHLIDAYFEMRPTGKLVLQPFVMRTEAFPNRRREPDLLVIMNDNPHEVRGSYIDGPADLVIEIVSEESVERDHGEKFTEYEKGGVPEYWIVDRLHDECRFYRLGDDGKYRRQVEDAEGNYRTATLPGLVLHVPTLWQENLPGNVSIVGAVTKMLEETDP